VQVSSARSDGDGDGRWRSEVNIRSTALQLTSIGIIQQQKRQSRSQNVRKLRFHISQYGRETSVINTSHFNFQRHKELRINSMLEETSIYCY
jgi:hypothetical protein